jgi:hypothetical protein
MEQRAVMAEPIVDERVIAACQAGDREAFRLLFERYKDRVFSIAMNFARSYPGHTNPAHIHAYVSGPGYPEYWINEYLFEGDPFIKDEVRQKAGLGSFSSILKLTRGSVGVLRGVRDIIIERCSKNCTGST